MNPQVVPWSQIFSSELDSYKAGKIEQKRDVFGKESVYWLSMFATIFLSNINVIFGKHLKWLHADFISVAYISETLRCCGQTK